MLDATVGLPVITTTMTCLCASTAALRTSMPEIGVM